MGAWLRTRLKDLGATGRLGRRKVDQGAGLGGTVTNDAQSVLSEISSLAQTTCGADLTTTISVENSANAPHLAGTTCP